MVKELAKKDILLFGELHNNPIAHWLEYEVTSDLHKLKDISLSAEMFESDNQTQLNSYLNNKINYEQLDSMARLWPNYLTDYAPLVDFAKEKKLTFTASNIPRRFANLVYKKGFESLDSLSEKEKSWIAPLPIDFDPELANYKNILTMMGDHGTPELVMAQAIKDATMAHFILKNYRKGQLLIHFNGTYHSDNYEGILWYLKEGEEHLNYGTISMVSQENINKLTSENKEKADFIICIDEDMTTTY